MILENAIHTFNTLASHISEWLYNYRNTQHNVGASNYVLMSLAGGIVVVGLIVELISANPNARRLVGRWWQRQNWIRHWLTDYPNSSTSVRTSSNVSLPLMASKNLTGSGGLTDPQVQKRLAAKQGNATHPRTSRSYRHIFFSNIFTRFNALLSGLYVIILWAGAPQDSVFGIIIVLNLIIGITQELRAKWTLDRLALVEQSKTQVVRNGALRAIPTLDIVLDDLIVLHVSDQVPVDGVIIQSKNLEVNESMVTGESEPVTKREGDPMYSGSFVVAGSCRLQAIHVGEGAYARRLANAAREFTLARSELRQGINQILRYVTWLLVPTALLLFVTQLLGLQNGWRDAVTASAGGVVNMVPDGLVLLTSMVMALAVVRLAKRHVLIQELPAVEMLARVDVLCLDKTGTLTEGAMAVENILPLPSSDETHKLPTDPKLVLGAFAQAQGSSPTLEAIGKACPAPTGSEWNIQENTAFSSGRKWSALTFEKNGTWILGAPEMVLTKEQQSESAMAAKLKALANGKRVLLLAFAKNPIQYTPGKNTLVLPALQPTALIVLQERLRPGVKQTLQYFHNQGVAIKIISGDSPATVAAVATAVGLTVDQPQSGQHLPEKIDELGKLVETQNVFGRVLPEQKKLMVQALQKRGHVVAMVGDGVNDVLAIKEADFSIAMGSGTDASRGTAQLVLLNNNFLALPDVIAEGRRIIGNIERTANLFITKTIYVMAIALAVGLARTPFPFLPRHLTLIGFFTVGAPALFLSFSRNTARAQPGFVTRVLRFTLPAGLMVAALTLITFAVTRQLVPTSIELARTVATLTLFGCGLVMLVTLVKPVTFWQKFFLGFLLVGMGLTIGHPSIRHVFALEWPSWLAWIMIGLMVSAYALGLRQVQRQTQTYQ